MQSPKVSVVTINYNMAAELESTIRNVVDQSYPALEYVVIDGGSTDGSPDVIRRHASNIAHWVSERDDGIYDAMNKGVAAATGEWVIFINAGDCFCDREVIADIFSAPPEDADILFGDVIRREADGPDKLVQARLDAMPLHMPSSHQSTFTRRRLLLAHPFAVEFSISADHEFLLWASTQSARLKKVPRAVAIFGRGGTSDRKRSAALRQLRRMLKRYGQFTPGVRLRYWLYSLRALTGPIARATLPTSLTHWLLKNKGFD